SLGELGLQRLELRSQLSHLCPSPCGLLLQGGIGDGLGSAARTLLDGLAYAHGSSCGTLPQRVRKTAGLSPSGLLAEIVLYEVRCGSSLSKGGLSVLPDWYTEASLLLS